MRKLMREDDIIKGFAISDVEFVLNITFCVLALLRRWKHVFCTFTIVYMEPPYPQYSIPVNVRLNV